MSTAAPLGRPELEQIGNYVRERLNGWLVEVAAPVAMDQQVIERIVRVEEELKFQRELIVARFAAVDQRFEDLFRTLDKRFEAVDKRFEAVDKRFEAVDQRFEDLFRTLDKRFAAVDQRFEDLFRTLDKRFEAVDKRFSALQWMIGGGVVLLATMMSIFQFLGAG